MQKRISFFEFQSVKNVAKAIEPKIKEQHKLETLIEKEKEAAKARIQELYAKYQSIQSEIDAFEYGIVNIIGFHTSDLVQKEVETSVDKNGRTVKTTKYTPTSIVTYDDTTKEYIITTPDSQDTSSSSSVEEPSAEASFPPTEEESPTSATVTEPSGSVLAA